MKNTQLIVFLTIVMSIYALVNTFLYYQTRPIFNLKEIGPYLKVLFWLLVISYPLGRTLESLMGGGLSTLMVKMGSIWLAAMLYLTLVFLVLQSAALVIKLMGADIFFQYRFYAAVSAYLLAGLIIAVGHMNAIQPRVSEIEIQTPKTLQDSNLRMVMVSDIHLGTIIGKRELSRLVKLINSQKPDIVFMVGDIFDEDVAPVVNGKMGELFELIDSKYGVYAVTGNHEFFSNYQAKIAYLAQHGVTVLNDSLVTVAGINVIGRLDRQSNLVLKKSRLNISELAVNADLSRFTIVLDHQPFNLNEAVESGIDLQLSGHTHHGQMWPFNYITQALYEVSMGYKRIGGTHFYVSPGYGTWGPRVRLGNRPEIAVIRVRRSG